MKKEKKIKLNVIFEVQPEDVPKLMFQLQNITFIPMKRMQYALGQYEGKSCMTNRAVRVQKIKDYVYRRECENKETSVMDCKNRFLKSQSMSTTYRDLLYMKLQQEIDIQKINKDGRIQHILKITTTQRQ